MADESGPSWRCSQAQKSATSVRLSTALDSGARRYAGERRMAPAEQARSRTLFLGGLVVNVSGGLGGERLRFGTGLGWRLRDGGLDSPVYKEVWIGVGAAHEAASVEVDKHRSVLWRGVGRESFGDENCRFNGDAVDRLVSDVETVEPGLDVGQDL